MLNSKRVMKMKKNYSEPELNVLHIGKEICTDVIAVSNSTFSVESNVGAADRFRDFEDYSY